MSSQDPIEDLLPLVLSKYEDELRRAANELLRTRQVGLDIHTGHIQARIQARSIIRPAALITVVSKDGTQVSRSWTRMSSQRSSDTAESIVMYLARALVHVLYDEGPSAADRNE